MYALVQIYLVSIPVLSGSYVESEAYEDCCSTWQHRRVEACRVHGGQYLLLVDKKCSV
jgi:hypothetical protein